MQPSEDRSDRIRAAFLRRGVVPRQSHLLARNSCRLCYCPARALRRPRSMDDSNQRNAVLHRERRSPQRLPRCAHRARRGQAPEQWPAQPVGLSSQPARRPPRRSHSSSRLRRRLLLRHPRRAHRPSRQSHRHRNRRGLAARARIALEPWPQVTVIHADGARGPFDPADVIVVSAGATHPLPAWLAALKPEGKLLFPLTSTRGPGTMAYLTRKSADLFAATLSGTVFFVDFEGARDPVDQRRTCPEHSIAITAPACALFVAMLTKKTNPAGCTATAGASRAARRRPPALNNPRRSPNLYSSYRYWLVL